LLTEVVDRYNKADPNVEAKCFLEVTKPTDALMQHAAEAQLVVVGTRGRNALSSAILGIDGG
jgi:nucleotide-binding universal stress UspA family protein